MLTQRRIEEIVDFLMRKYPNADTIQAISATLARKVELKLGEKANPVSRWVGDRLQNTADKAFAPDEFEHRDI